MSGNMWKCPHCGGLNPGGNTHCAGCKSPSPGLIRFPTINTSQSNVQRHHPNNAVIVIVFVLFLIICIYGVSMIPTNYKGNDPSTNYTEFDAISLVKNWKPSENQGLTCEETYDAIVLVYRENLGINGAEVVWSAEKTGVYDFIVSANLKGETGWAEYDWQVNMENKSIINITQAPYAICK